MPEKHERDYQNVSKQRTAAFMYVLQSTAEGCSPEEAAKKARVKLEKERAQRQVEEEQTQKKLEEHKATAAQSS